MRALDRLRTQGGGSSAAQETAQTFMNILYWLAPLCDWDKINQRRCDLIMKSIEYEYETASDKPTMQEEMELETLQRFAQIYVSEATCHDLETSIIAAEVTYEQLCAARDQAT